MSSKLSANSNWPFGDIRSRNSEPSKTLLLWLFQQTVLSLGALIPTNIASHSICAQFNRLKPFNCICLAAASWRHGGTPPVILTLRSIYHPQPPRDWIRNEQPRLATWLCYLENLCPISYHNHSSLISFFFCLVTGNIVRYLMASFISIDSWPTLGSWSFYSSICKQCTT